MYCGWVFKQNAQRFQKMDKLSLTAFKNKPLLKEWLVRIKKGKFAQTWPVSNLFGALWEASSEHLT